MSIVPIAIPLNPFTTWAKAHRHFSAGLIEPIFVNIVHICLLLYRICILRSL